MKRKVYVPSRVDTTVRSNTNRTRASMQALLKSTYPTMTPSTINSRLKALGIRLLATSKKITKPLAR